MRLVTGELDAGRRVLVGLDFPFGYPSGVAEHLTGHASALVLWDWLAALKRLIADPLIRGRGALRPFDTGLIAPDAPAVIAEVYPSLLKGEVAARKRGDEILDRAQVRVNADAFARLDACGGLAPLFAGTPLLTPAERRLVETEEGWILGLGHEEALKGALAPVCCPHCACCRHGIAIVGSN